MIILHQEISVATYVYQSKRSQTISKQELSLALALASAREEDCHHMQVEYFIIINIIIF